MSSENANNEFCVDDGRPISELKVVELRKELELRSLPKSGNKKELYERLREYLQNNIEEEAKTNAHEPPGAVSSIVGQYLATQQQALKAAKRSADLLRAESVENSSSGAEEGASPKRRVSEQVSAEPAPAQTALSDAVSPTAGQTLDHQQVFVTEAENVPAKDEQKESMEERETEDQQISEEKIAESTIGHAKPEVHTEIFGDKMECVPASEIVGPEEDERGEKEEKFIGNDEEDKIFVGNQEEEHEQSASKQDSDFVRAESTGSSSTTEAIDSAKQEEQNPEFGYQQIQPEPGEGHDTEVPGSEDKEMQPTDKTDEMEANDPSPSETQLVTETPEDVNELREGKSMVSTEKQEKGAEDELLDYEEEAGQENEEDSLKHREIKGSVSPKRGPASPGAVVRTEGAAEVVGNEKPLEKTLDEADLLTPEGLVRRKAVSPARHSVTRWLHIRGLKRPYTQKALMNLLGTFGTLIEDEFWIDNIKSNCIVTYEKDEQAQLARERLHNTVWPTSSDQHLTVEYSTAEKLKRRKADDAREHSAANKERLTVVIDNRNHKEEQPMVLLMQEEKEREAPMPRKRSRAEELQKAPEKTLDDLFKKTKTLPAIYFLPLTEAEVLKKYGKTSSSSHRHSSSTQHKNSSGGGGTSSSRRK